MILFWLGLALMMSVPVWLTLYLVAIGIYIRVKYVKLVVRIFQEKPLFVIPRGDRIPDAEDVIFPTSNGLKLRGCYLATPRPRRGVILFGLEFGSNRWSCRVYVEHLLEVGFDIFAFEPRNQGESDQQTEYDPLQWVTDFEVRDTQAAIAYLKSRSDADPNGIGLFGISKGGSAGLFVASRDPYIRCCVTDGAFASYTVLVPYMRHWFKMYHTGKSLGMILPSWYYGIFGLIGLRQIEKIRHCRFPHLESAMPRLKQPLLLIHGQADAYIKPSMARALFDSAGSKEKEFWLVAGAKHNQALHEAGDEYRLRILRFFEKHLATEEVILDRNCAESALPTEKTNADHVPQFNTR